MKVLLTMLFISFLSGCASAPTRPIATPPTSNIRGIHYTVRPGDTVWSISRMYGVDMDTILKANSIHDSSAIERGQVLIIPATLKPKEPRNLSYSSESFIWPVKGCTIASYGDKIDNAINKGIDIQAPDGASVTASRSGRVVYCDSHLKGFGKTVILDHGDNYQTVYSYNSEILVKVGDNVSRRDIIARVGRSGRAKEASLHFEIRKDGKPRNPMYYLSR
ncbi:MAG: LysM peptidoglycan-binding domain-containing M23 family metallopeptidase [Candidatus Omnitrophota bacterium]|jgi:murein DD-endopeptidase MepM/ murein hydrolase activator NlpD